MPPHADVLQWEHLSFPRSLPQFQRLFPDDAFWEARERADDIGDYSPFAVDFLDQREADRGRARTSKVNQAVVVGVVWDTSPSPGNFTELPF